ncbi:hypothetical protein D918_03003 [Trichuris suis]|nr:hypothetical protein D918_03003 [Trichuris suis]
MCIVIRVALCLQSNSGVNKEPRNLMLVECEYASEVAGAAVGQPLTAICYERTENNATQPSAEELCTNWRYPGTEVPQLKIPEHLKSALSRIYLILRMVLSHMLMNGQKISTKELGSQELEDWQS